MLSLLFCLSLAIASGSCQRSARASVPAPRQGIKAADGSTIIDRTVTINGLQLRYKVAAPDSALTTASGDGTQQRLGLNVLLHGDGGDSFVDFPNANVQGGLMGVVVLAPNEALLWGGQSTRTVDRPDGVAHATAVDTLIREGLSKSVAFDPAQVYFSGVSGGSLLLSGFFVPMFMSKYKTGVMFMCGGLVPPQSRQGLTNTLDEATMQNMRIHWQTSQAELSSLKQQIPPAVLYYESLARQMGNLNDNELNVKQTSDATPTGRHCAFDNKAFTSGIRLVSSRWSNIMQGGDGTVPGLGMVSKGVIGREKVYSV